MLSCLSPRARRRPQPDAANCHRMRPVVGIYGGWILKRFPRSRARIGPAPPIMGPCMLDRSGGKCLIDPAVSSLLTAVDALRVHPQQHLHAVTCIKGSYVDLCTAGLCVRI